MENPWRQDADALFLNKDVVALGWSRVGDIAGLSADREQFKARVAEAYPDAKAGAIPVNAG